MDDGDVRERPKNAQGAVLEDTRRRVIVKEIGYFCEVLQSFRLCQGYGVVLKVPNKAKINGSGRKIIPLCGVPRDTKRSYSVFESGKIIRVLIRGGAIMNRRRDRKTDGEKIVSPL